MSYTDTEALYFYWHCKTAGLILENVELNTATRVHLANAVRMATLNAAGKKGVHYATRAAHDHRAGAGKDWHQHGFIREHVFPVSLICSDVLDAWKSDRKSWSEVAPTLTPDDLINWNAPPIGDRQNEAAPLSATIASLVRKLTVLAWATKADNTKLKVNGLTKSMPVNYDGKDLLARYRACEIELVNLASTSLNQTHVVAS